jgi:metallo-beta-lactamase family protein
MSIRLQFWGAAQTVTGSSHHLECAGQNVLLDCGMFQGHRQQAREINSHLALPASQLSAVVLSHAHIDHNGNLPTLIKQGYRGPIYATPASLDLCAQMLKDSVHIQESDAEFVNKRVNRRRSIGIVAEAPGVTPLYTQGDAEQAMRQFKSVKLHKPQLLAGSTARRRLYRDDLRCRSHVGIDIPFAGSSRKGADDAARVLRRYEPPPAAEYLIMESTHGNRLHQPVGPVKRKLENLVNRTVQRGGHIVMPAFAVGRTQQLVMLLHELINANAIPNLPIFVDCPLAVNVTDVFRKHEEEWDEEAREFGHRHADAFGWQRLRWKPM